MASLRDRLKAYNAQTAASKPAQVVKTDCFQRLTKAPRDQTFSNLLTGAALEALTGTPFPDTPPEGLLFLDTETTGLSGGAGTVAFLVGMGYFTQDSFVVEQDLMRDYDEEGFLLDHVAQRLSNAQILITFNGKTFDMPLLESRFTMNRLRDRYRLPPHVDLLHCARATFKLRLGRCSLSALEEKLFGMKREDDLPGSEVPKQYFDYLRCHDFSLLEPILTHNCQDILTLPTLLHQLLSLYQNPLSSSHVQDIYSIGRVMEKRGGRENARRCFRAADQGSMSRLSRLMLADSYRRDRQYQACAEVYRNMIASGQSGAFPYIALAKLCEHQFKDPEQALQLTRRAILLMDPYDERSLGEAQKRALRLMKKCGRND